MIKAVVFDMDGLLVDSEPIWQQVAIEAFEEVGVKLSVELCQEATGLGTTDFIAYVEARHPWEGKTAKQLADTIIERAHERIRNEAVPMPGAEAVVRRFHGENLALAVASASPMAIIEAVLDRLELKPFFTLWHSADLEKRSKPHPDVYLGALDRLGLLPLQALAFEDSGNGLRSAHSAGLKTVAVPAAYEFDDPKFSIANLKIASLLELDESKIRTLLHSH